YLFKCLRNRIYKEIKEEKRKISFNSSQVGEHLLLADTLENELIKDQVDKEKSARLLSAMKKLSPRQREVIRHFFFDSQSYEEIAEMMGINVQSVYTLAWKAISRLKKNMMGSILLLLADYL
ncbi:MAG: sigma-70 family RNA polymerase sigma factor, partial [Cyclobacteriaceae bacterium]